MPKPVTWCLWLKGTGWSRGTLTLFTKRMRFMFRITPRTLATTKSPARILAFDAQLALRGNIWAIEPSCFDRWALERSRVLLKKLGGESLLYKLPQRYNSFSCCQQVLNQKKTLWRVSLIGESYWTKLMPLRVAYWCCIPRKVTLIYFLQKGLVTFVYRRCFIV